MISCIIPTKDRRRFIGAAIRSVLAQSGLDAPIEIVVVDDGSKDHTQEYIKATFPQVKLIEAGGVGPGEARNIGAQEAKGEVLMFLDSDDVWHRRHARSLLDAMEAQGARCAFGVTRTIDLENREQFFIPKDHAKIKRMSKEAWRLLGYWCFFVPSSFAIEKAAFEKSGGFRADTTVGLGEDWLFFLSLSMEMPLASTSDVVTTRRLQPSSLCKRRFSPVSLLRLLDMVEEELRAQGRLGKDLKRLYEKRRELIQKEGRAWNSVQEWYTAMSNQGLIPEGL